MEGKNKKQYTEVSRKSRVKMHKSGKHWVRTVMSQIGFIQLGKRSDNTGSEVKLASSKHPTSATRMMRGLIAAGAVVSGGSLCRSSVCRKYSGGFRSCYYCFGK
ncbi:KxYKxGKxW signal peptide domain-containing protein [Streptococcus suis]|uniref:KxYKxGKxW signal peptide domain-containing protein n=1 Tax=Streptococcus suis TaxID=1307 RepID=UPI003CC51B90